MSCKSAGPAGGHNVGVIRDRYAGGSGETLGLRHQEPPWADGERRANWCLSGPSRGADHSAEILGPEGGILVGEHIGVDIAKGRLGSGMDGVVKGLDDLFLEVAGARVCADDGFPLGLSELGKTNAAHGHL